MSPRHSDTLDPGPSPEHPSWILAADMAGPPDRIVHPRPRSLALRRRWLGDTEVLSACRSRERRAQRSKIISPEAASVRAEPPRGQIPR